MRVLILHGWGGSDHPHWQSKLASKLACNYKRVYFPLLKNPHFPTLNSWLKELREIMIDFKPTVVVCHSLANTLWFWYANEADIELDRLYLVAPPSIDTDENTIKSFFPPPKPKSLLAKELTFVVSSNDLWSSVEETELLAKEYSANFKIVDSAGHINADSGYGDWEWIFKEFNLKFKCED